MKFLKSFFLIFLVFVFAVGVYISSVNASYQPTPGDIVKINSTDRPALYLINSSGQRQLFSNAVTFWTWHSGNWNDIKDANGNKVSIKLISQADFDTIPSAKNVVARIGVKLIKFDNSGNVYAVSGSGVLNKIASLTDETVAKRLYGDSYKNQIIIIQSSFESDYKEEQPFTVNSVVPAPSGNILTASDQVPPASSTPYCEAGSHYDSASQSCSSNNSACSIANGVGAKNWNGSSWGDCNLVHCNNGYEVRNGSCLLIAPACPAGQHLVVGSCEINIESCFIYKGTGNRVWTDGSGWGECRAVGCNYNYTLTNGQCVANTTACDIGTYADLVVGTGAQTWMGNFWGVCKPTSCISGFSASSTTNECEPYYHSSCTDYDGGKDYFSKSYAILGDQVFLDYCDDYHDNDLVERSCSGGLLGLEYYKCPNGCSNGACIR